MVFQTAFKRAFCLLTVAAILVAGLCLSVSAQANYTLNLSGEFSTKTNVLTVELILKHPNKISSGLIALQYDNQKLKLASDAQGTVAQNTTGPTPASGIMASLCASDAQKGYVWIDWYTNTPLEPSEDGSLIATIYFILDPSVNHASLSEGSIYPCSDKEFLDNLAGYGSDGGVLICYGSNSYNFASGQIDVDCNYLAKEIPLASNGKEILYLEVTEVYVESGQAPVLPSQITVTYNDATMGTETVGWDYIDPAKYAKNNVFDVYGTVVGCSSRAKCTVVVGKGDTEYIENDGSDTITADNTDKISITGNAVQTESFKVVQIDPSDAVLDPFRKYVGNGYSLTAFLISTQDGGKIATDGKKFNVTIDVGRKYNGQTWTLLRFVNGEITRTDYVVIDGSITVTVADTSLLVFRVPGTTAAKVIKTEREENAPWLTGGKLAAIIITAVGVFAVLAFYFKDKLLSLFARVKQWVIKTIAKIKSTDKKQAEQEDKE